MQIKQAEHVTTAVWPNQYPNSEFIEIAMVGRSNAGKSSLINIVANRKNLAYVGKTPGKTRQINFFNFNDEFNLVDLPGYGYAKVSKAEQSSWSDIINSYLTQRQQLSAIILLVDIRHKPSKEDIQMFEWIKQSGKKHAIIAAKHDKIKRSQVRKQIQLIANTFQLETPNDIIPFSALKKTGKEKVMNFIERVIKEI